MYGLLDDLAVVEGASFIAAPLCALNLQRMGAEVIRFDPIGGGPDFRRWPQAKSGASLYWEGLNKGKKSVAINLSVPEGRELAAALAASTGLFVTNYPADGFLSHAALSARRADLITVRVMGWADGGNALDYTVNAALGVPLITGPAEMGEAPVNHVLPAWDVAAGLYGAFAALAAERRRMKSGEGGEVRVPLGDIAIATLSDIGLIGEAATGKGRGRHGNDLFGAFGRDFPTADGKRVMIAAITPRNWSGLLAALGIGEAVAAVEGELSVSFARDETARFVHRDRLNPIVEAATAARALADLATAFEANAVIWAPYRPLVEALREDARLGPGNPLLAPVRHISGETYLTAGAPAAIPSLARGEPGPAPMLGQHSEEVLAARLGLASGQIGDLIDRGIVSQAG